MTVQEFLQLNESSIGASGAGWDSCDALNQLNQSRSALYGLHNYTGLISTVCMFCTTPISMPWFGESIKSAFRCCRNIDIVRGEQFAYVGDDCCGAQEGIVDTGEYSPVPGSNSFNSRLGFKTINADDAGKKLKVSYVTAAGSNQTDEFELSTDTFSVTEMDVVKVISIWKESTSGMVYAYSMDSNGNCCERLFGMHPLETNLKYRLYCLSDLCCSSCSRIVLKVKKKYFPFTAMHYNHPIDFVEHGLSLAMEAIASKNKRTPEGLKLYNELFKSAINYIKINTVQEEQTTFDMSYSNDYPGIPDDIRRHTSFLGSY